MPEKFLSSKTQRQTKATGNTAEKSNKKRKKRKKMPGGTAARRFDRDRKRKERLLKRLMVNPGQDKDSVIQVENHKRPPWFTKYFTSSMSIIKK